MSKARVQTQLIFTGWLACSVLSGWAQQNGTSTRVKLTDPSRPALVKAAVLNGSITVKGYDGKEVLVEADQRGVEVKESDNEVTVEAGPMGLADLRISVPFRTSLQLKCTTGGNIRVESVEGEIEANGSNASITLRKVSGVVLAHSLQGRVHVQMDRVAPGKPMSFSTMNGDIDVSLPADTKAEVKLQTLNGTVQSDFAIQSAGDSPPKSAKRISGAINGGGPDIQLKALNGSLYLKKNVRPQL